MSVNRFVVLAVAVVLTTSLAACGEEPSRTPVPSATVEPSPTIGPTSIARDGPDLQISQSANELLVKLPEVAGGVQFDGVQIVDESLNVGHPLDDALAVVGMERRDAVSVFRYSEDASATIGATVVEGIGGEALLQAFVDTWHAPAVTQRWQRPAAGTTAWELGERGGRMNVLYVVGNVVYLVSTPDAATLEAIILEMPTAG